MRRKTTRTAAGPAVLRTAAAPELTRFVLPGSVRVVDEAKREIEVCATSEAVDTYGTIFAYDASKDAFSRWAGNVREMHERKAVGRKVDVRADDDAKKVYVRLRVSKGAQDTWEKVLDGTLSGASIGAANVAWTQQRRGGDTVPVATRYDLVELSLVDLASNPDAQGISFVRDGVPSVDVLDDVEPAGSTPAAPDAERAGDAGIAASGPASGSSAGAAPASPAAAPSPAPAIIERDGSLSREDTAAQIAAGALARGRAELAGAASGAAASNVSGADAKRARLAGLGAPDFANSAARASSGQGQVVTSPDSPSGDTIGGTAPGEGASGANVGQTFDLDGDHEDPSDYVPIQSGPTAGAVMAPSPAGSVAHMAHNHHHTGRYDDPSNHRETSAHMHLDGSSHTHDHEMDHRHGDHSGFPAGHAHPHVHVPDHDHYYRVADGAPIDARLVGVEQVRTWEYVSAAAFRSAGGVEGRGLSVPQFRTAQGYELRAAQQTTQRDMGPYSRDPNGPADAGTPAAAEQHTTSEVTGEGALGDGNGGVTSVSSSSDLESELMRTGRCPLCQGQIRALDRDGQPVAGADANGSGSDNTSTTGTLDVSTPADGWTGRALEASLTRALDAAVGRMIAPLSQMGQALRGLNDRVQSLEAQPMPGGPVFRAADKGTPLLPSGGQPGIAEQQQALESLAGRLRDPQAQVAVAAEMIRLQQEAAGVGPAMQVMPRAGAGWGVTGR